ncbi:glutaredoxin-C13 [Capsicum chacoense]
MDKVQRMTREHGVVIFSKSTCCLCYAVSILFQDLGVIPYVYEIDHDPQGKEVENALMRMGCNNALLPLVFIAGKLVGSTNEVMSLHLKGSLIQLIKPYMSV